MRAFVVTIDAADAEVASDRFWQLGVRAIEERVAADGSERIELWTAVGEDVDSIERAAGSLPPDWAWRSVEVSDASAETWREFAAPMWIRDDLVIVPEWQQLANDVRAAPTGPLVVSIEPAGAFGLGDHPTTELCLRVLADWIAARPGGVADGPPSVLDVGCGTGILAITAALLGAAWPVRAIDVASAAVEATRANADLNGVADSVEVDTADVGDLVGSFDLVLANVLAPALVTMAPDLRRLTAPGGSLVVSGILAAAHDHVVAALEPMSVVGCETLGEWAAVTFSHP